MDTGRSQSESPNTPSLNWAELEVAECHLRDRQRRENAHCNALL